MKFLMYFIFLIISFVFNIVYANDSTLISVRGIVTDEKDKPLKDVKISYINKKNQNLYNCFSDKNGTYQITVVNGLYDINVSLKDYINYEELSIEISKGFELIKNFTLSKKIYSTDEIFVEGNRQNQNDLRTSLFNISPLSIKVLPGGLEDIMRSLKSLPGVSSPNDFTSQLIIRGSGPDQNLIIMDEVEIFNPYRLYGLVSMFNPETLSDINLMTGGFPAKYGDRLSAVLDVVNKEGTREKYISALANINIANANIIFQGKNPKIFPGSWIISARRTYYDVFIGPFAKKAGLITDNSSFPSFQDLQIKLSFDFIKNSKIIFNSIISKDGVDIIPGDERSDPDSVNVADVTTNDVFSLGWHYFPNNKFVSKTTFSLYKNTGDNNFDGDILDPLLEKENLSPTQRDSLKQIGALLGFKFKSSYSFNKISLTNRSVIFSGKNKFEFGAGVDLINNDLTYKLNLDENFKAFIRSFPNSAALLEDFTISGNRNLRSNLYLLGRFDIASKFYIQPSIRLDYYEYLNKFYLSPRINAGYIVNPLTTLRFSAGVYYQSPGYEKLVDNQTFYDFNNSINESLKAEKAIHYILSFEHWLNNEWQVKLETYYKNFSNLLVQEKLTGYKYQYYVNDPLNKDPNYLKNPVNWTRSSEKIPYDSFSVIPVNNGGGEAVGIEISLEKKYSGPKSKLYGWINYSFSKATRKRDEIIYPFRFNQPHVINVVLNYRINNWLEIGARWNYASNFPFTEPIGIVPRVSFDTLVVNPLNNQIIFNLDYGGTENRLKARRPAYHRLDVRITAFAYFWKADWSFYLDIMNVYNRKNVIGYDYYLKNDLTIGKETIGMIPILPTIGISTRF